jgi:hypothetical protein
MEVVRPGMPGVKHAILCQAKWPGGELGPMLGRFGVSGLP